MSDFLSSLIARSYTDAPVIQPRVPSLFETTPDEFLDEPQPSTPAIGARETITPTSAPALVPKSSAIQETATTKPIANVSAARAEERRSKPKEPPDQNAPAIAEPPQLRAHPVRVKKLELETKKLEVERNELTVPVHSVRDGSKRPQSEVFSERPPVQSRRRKDFLPIQQRSPNASPIIHVTIGRVEVRAIHPAAPQSTPAKPAPPRISLEDYLRKRERSAR
jgi:hypothetical protein